MLMLNNQTKKKEYWGALDIDVLFFPKKIVREKWNFYNAYAIADPVLIVNFRIDAEIFIGPLKCLIKAVTIRQCKEMIFIETKSS